jgi:predicted RNase H-like HicB family nuclease
MKKKFNIIIRKEWKKFITRVLENNISSFWDTKEEALKNTYEALELYNEEEPYNNSYSIKEATLLE